MISAMFTIAGAGKATAASISLSPGPTPVAGGSRICRTGITTRGVIIRSPVGLTMVCRIITRGITAGTFMSVSAGTGQAGIGIDGTIGMVAIRIIGTVHMSLLSRIRM